MTTHLNRRHFIRNSAAAGLGLAALGRARAASPNNKLNVACIGLGGQMQTDLQQSAALGHNIVAVCDVDKGRLDFTRKERGAEIQAAKSYLRLKDEPKFRGADNHDAAKQVPVSLPRAPGNSHMREWTEACTGGAKTFSPFEIGGHITEIGAAGLVALRIGHDIDWDGPAMKVPGLPAADALIKPQSRAF